MTAMQPEFINDKFVIDRTPDRRKANAHYGAMAAEASSLQGTLQERGKRYGAFTGHAKVTQDYKRLLAAQLADREKELPDDQQEALEMIFHKIGRIVNGDNNYDDSWQDIAGYAELVAKRLQGTAL